MTLKQEVEELKTKIENRILNGDYEVVSSELKKDDFYIGNLNISVDGMQFHFTVNKEYKTVCQHGGPIELLRGHYDPGHLNIFKKHFDNPDIKAKRIKELKNELQNLEK